MKNILIPLIMAFLLVFCGLCFAGSPPKPIPISADRAFDAVQMQKDPLTEDEKDIALVDVRTRAEFVWVGAACEVDEIETKKRITYFPDYGKVKLTKNSRYLIFSLNHRRKKLKLSKITKIEVSPIAINIPFLLWNETDAKLEKNPAFRAKIEELAHDYDVLIFFCRSGGRSSACLGSFKTELFDAIYEIDHPSGQGDKGGFEGSTYSGVYIGYRGFPARWTKRQEHPSVSWKDAGLPIKTGPN